MDRWSEHMAVCVYHSDEVMLMLMIHLENWDVVVRLPRPMEGNGVTPIFRSLQNCRLHLRRMESLEHFNVLYIYYSEHYGLLFLDLRMPFFLQGLPFLRTGIGIPREPCW